MICRILRPASRPSLRTRMPRGHRIKSFLVSDNIEFKAKDGAPLILTLCERVPENSKTEEQRSRDEEAKRLSNGLLIELRRTTTIVKQ